jgi:hypothetical protein
MSPVIYMRALTYIAIYTAEKTLQFVILESIDMYIFDLLIGICLGSTGVGRWLRG